jgi:hypothetical protein
VKYSTGYMSNNLLSQKVAQQLQLQLKAMLKENPNLLDNPLTDMSGVEHYVTFSNCVEMLDIIKESKDFVIETDIVKHFYEKKHIKQNFNISMKSPFKRIFITFEDPIPIKMAIPKNMKEYMDLNYDEWLRMVTGNPEHNLIEIDDRLHGILITNDLNKNKIKMEATLNLQKEKRTMSVVFEEYYKKANPKTTFKVFFVTDMSRGKQDYYNNPYLKKDSEGYTKEKEEALLNFLNTGFEYSDVIFDSALLPEFISEFEISKMNLYTKPLNNVVKGLQNLMNLTVNLINFINSNETVEYTPIYKSNKQQKKYFQKTGKSLTPLFYLLKVKYPREIIIGGVKGQPHSEYSYQFDVKGFFRHLRSPRYKNKRGQIIWIQPFKKGKGIYIPKNYVVDSPKEVVDEYKWDEKTGV